MENKSKRVAVIGAGVSGIASAKYLRSFGIDVVLYERGTQLGGIWIFDERKPPEPRYPTRDVEVDVEVEGSIIHNGTPHYDHIESHSVDEIDLHHAPPGPAYDSLTNNISILLQQFKDYPWPKELPDTVNTRVIAKYIQDWAKSFNIEPLIKFNTLVEHAEKVGAKWRLHLSTLVKENSHSRKKIQTVEEFDGVVVCSGNNQCANIPDIPGLVDWKRLYPNQVQHSNSYRRPEEFKDQTILVIGASASSMDIVKELVPIAKKVYRCSRGGKMSIPLSLLPPETEGVEEVVSFTPPLPGDGLKGTATTIDGIILTGIDQVILATGYLRSYPFLSEYNNHSMPVKKADQSVLITDGSQVHNLHRDMFYINDPTLAFVGVSAFVTTFTLYEFQAIAVACFFSGRALLPTTEEMREEYQRKVVERGHGRNFHSLFSQQLKYVDELVEWVNSRVDETGDEQIEGHTEFWVQEDARVMKMLEDKYSSIMQALREK